MEDIEILSDLIKEDIWNDILARYKDSKKASERKAYSLMTSSKKMEETTKQDGLYMLTINLNNDNLKELKKFTEKVIKWAPVYQYAYCYEVTKKNSPHSHLLLKINNIGRFNYNLSRQKYKPPAIKFHPYSSWENGIRYLQGYKKGQLKPQHDMDILLRRKNNLLDIYLSHQDGISQGRHDIHDLQSSSENPVPQEQGSLSTTTESGKQDDNDSSSH